MVPANAETTSTSAPVNASASSVTQNVSPTSATAPAARSQGCPLATAERWKTYRRIITKLYGEKTLNDVMRIMQDKYSFFATKNMYKSRLARWGFQKNLKCDQVAEYLQKTSQRDAVGKPSIMSVHGRQFDFQRVGAYICRSSKSSKRRIAASLGGGHSSSSLKDVGRVLKARRQVTCRTPPPAPARARSRASSTSSHAGTNGLERWVCPPKLSVLYMDAPDNMRMSEHSLAGIRAYINANFDYGKWTRDFNRSMTEVNAQTDYWFTRFSIAVEQLSFDEDHSSPPSHRVTYAFKLIGSCFQQLEFVIMQCGIDMILEFYYLFISLKYHAEIAKELKQHLYYLSSLKFGPSQPLTVLFDQLRNMDHAELVSSWAVLADCYYDSIRSRLDGAVEPNLEINHRQVSVVYRMCCQGVLPWETGESIILENMSGLKTTGSYHELMVLFRVRLAACLYKRDRAGEALQILLSMLNQQDEPTDCWFKASEWARSSLCKGLQIIYFQLGQMDAARYYAKRAVWRQDMSAGHYQQTISNNYRAERLCRSLGDYEAADRACLDALDEHR